MWDCEQNANIPCFLLALEILKKGIQKMVSFLSQFSERTGILFRNAQATNTLRLLTTPHNALGGHNWNFDGSTSTEFYPKITPKGEAVPGTCATAAQQPSPRLPQ
jgi:hypothetical protein